jgi:glycosyltransferase involved in cell wall biosynthesis
VVNGRFVTQPLTGVQRYCFELSLRLRSGMILAPSPALDDYRRLRDRVVVTGGRLTGHPWEQFQLPWSVPRNGALLSPAGCGPLAHQNHVVTIHDLAVLERPEWYSRSFALWYTQLLPALCKRARRIITVSNFCKRRIVESLGVSPDKVAVIGEAASGCFFPQTGEVVRDTLKRFGLRTPYFLAVGAVSGRKNLTRLLGAWTQVANRVDGAGLAIVAKEGLRFAGCSVLGRLPERTVHFRSVTDEELACLYSGSLGLLYPSLYEGFGLPILEAMACGCPVLTSNCTAMPEVASDAAILVDPLSEEAIAEGIVDLTCRRRADDLRTRGFQRCREFSWESTALDVERILLN